MNKLKLYVGGKQLDFFADENITLTSKLSDEEIYYDGLGSFSKEFTVPASVKNNAIFQNYNRFDINSLDPHQSYSAWIEVDSSQIRGNVEVKGCNYTNNNPDSYILTFYGNENLITDIYGVDKLLNTVDWGRIGDGTRRWDLMVNYETIVGSFDGSKSFIFPLWNNKRPLIFDPYDLEGSGQTNGNNIATQLGAPGGVKNNTPIVGVRYKQNGIKCSDLSPGFDFKMFFDDVLLRSNTSYTDGYVVEYGDRILEFIGTGNTRLFIYPCVETSQNEASGGTYCFIATGTTTGFTGYQDIQIYKYCDENDGTFDFINRKWVVDVSAYYKISQQIDVSSYAGPYTTTWSIIKNGVAMSYNDFVVLPGTHRKIIDLEFILNAGDEITWEYTLPPVFAINHPTTYISTLTIERDVTDKINTIIRINDILPEITTIDFIKGVLFHFNLILILSEKDKKIRILSKDDWYSEHSTYDLSTYMITDKWTARKPEVFKKIDIKYKNGEDIGNTRWSGKYLKQFGEYVKYNNFKFGTEELLRESIFCLPPSDLWFEFTGSSESIVYGDIEQYQMINEAGDMIVNPFSLFFYDGYLDTNDYYGESNYYPYNLQRYYLDFAGGPYDTPNGLPKTHAYCNSLERDCVFHDERVECSRSLCYDGVHYNEDFNNNLYTIFYKNETDNLESISTRDVDFSFILPNYIMVGLKLNDRILVNGHQYLIREYTYSLIDGRTTMKLRTKNNWA